MLPRRLGVRFALEALFLVALAVGAGLADLRPLYIVLVMAAAWLLVALAELTAERIDRSPLSYVLPRAPAAEEEPQQVFGPRPEERTVVAPLERAAEPPASEPAPEAEQITEPEPTQPEAEEEQEEPQPRRLRSLLRRREPEPETEPEPTPPEAEEEQEQEEPQPRRLRSLLRRREPEPEMEPASAPRHVKLLPRRPAPEPSRASQDVAELFGARPDETEDGKPEEAGK